MIVVGHSFALKIISRIDIFQLDLGSNLSGPYDENKQEDVFKFKISDKFIKSYKTSTNRIVYKFGDVGSLSFYDDPLLSRKEMIIFKDDKIYDIELDLDILAKDTRRYLSFILENAGKENIEDNYYEGLENDSDIATENVTIQNGKAMNKNDYINAMVAKRKKLG